jgi:hypothetical protein
MLLLREDASQRFGADLVPPVHNTNHPLLASMFTQ